MNGRHSDRASQELVTHNGASPPSIDALQNDQWLRHASDIRLTGRYGTSARIFRITPA